MSSELVIVIAKVEIELNAAAPHIERAERFLADALDLPAVYAHDVALDFEKDELRRKAIILLRNVFVLHNIISDRYMIDD